MKDNPYIVKLDPEAFNEVFESMERELEDIANETDLVRHRKTVERVLASCRTADREHVCLDEVDDELHGTYLGRVVAK